MNNITIEDFRRNLLDQQQQTRVEQGLAHEARSYAQAILDTYSSSDPIYTEADLSSRPNLSKFREILQNLTNSLFPTRDNRNPVVKIELAKTPATYWDTETKPVLLGLPFSKDFYDSLPELQDGGGDDMSLLDAEKYKETIDLLIHELTHVVERYLGGNLYRDHHFRPFLLYTLNLPDDYSITDKELKKRAAEFFHLTGQSREWTHIESDELAFGKIYKTLLGWLMKKRMVSENIMPVTQ
jgi:hypothetical protein